MNGFKNVNFKGKFRDYQQRVLDNANKYLKDGKINIVAAPGSGKTVLGLELIRRLASPCIILSPTTAIRQQWGERFKDLFLDNAEDFPALFSNDLHNITLINSITYQALYTAVDKISTTEDVDIDCSDVDIFSTIDLIHLAKVRAASNANWGHDYVGIRAVFRLRHLIVRTYL